MWELSSILNRKFFKCRAGYDDLGNSDYATLGIVICWVDKNGAISILPISAADKEGKGGYFFPKPPLISKNQQTKLSLVDGDLCSMGYIYYLAGYKLYFNFRYLLLHPKEQYELDPLHVIYESVHVIYMVMGEFPLIPSGFCKILHAGSQHI